jgi:hypothetical protein
LDGKSRLSTPISGTPTNRQSGFPDAWAAINPDRSIPWSPAAGSHTLRTNDEDVPVLVTLK